MSVEQNSRENTRGSEWSKWDLHVHTPASDGEGTPEEIVNEAITKGLSVIAITDHHTANGIDEIKAAAKDKPLTVISGIEFRSEYGSKSVHFIGYFPDYYDGTELNSKALHDLILSKIGLSETDIIANGHIDGKTMTDDQLFREGMFKVQVDLKKTAQLIHKYGGLVCVHNGNKSNGLDAEVKHYGSGKSSVHTLYESLGTLKEELMTKYIDICDVGMKENNSKFYLETFNRPSIVASDAHRVSDIGSVFTWIKAEPTFEGLEQIIYEPQDRVRIQEVIPEEKPDYQIIDSIDIKHGDFGEQKILFNQNLNTIIGGRSSGKSILLSCIAKKVGYTGKVKNIAGKNSNTGLTYDEYIKTICDSMTITWRDEKNNREGNDQASASGQEKSMTNRKISFYRQSEINSYACDQMEINRIVDRIITQSKEKKQEKNLYAAFCIDNQKNINIKIQDYIERRIYNLSATVYNSK